MPKLNSTEILGDLRVTNDATVDATLTTNSLSVEGNILLTGDATTTNQGRLIDFTGFDKEGTTDFSDRAFIQHTTNTGGHSGSVLLISSQNDSSDGIAFSTNASSYLKHNSNNIFTDAYHPNADKWTTARTLSLTGAVTGSVSWDGSGNASLATTATADPTLTLAGDASGSATFTNLGNATLTVTVANNSHEHSQLYENSTITYGASYLQWMDQNGTGGAGTNGTAPRNPANGWYHNLIMNHANNGGYYSQIATGLNSSDIYFTRVQNGSAQAWQRIFADDYHPNADKWTTARTLSLTGDVTGSVSWDGSANASITTTVQEVTITDTRNNGDTTPNDFSNRAAAFSFTDDITNSPNTWDSVLTMKGWDDDYRVWQLFSGSSTSSDTNLNLHFRTGIGTSWGSIQTVFTDAYHPNADKWTTARTLSLTGDVTGSVSWDGSGNASLATTVVNDSHNHDHSDGNFTVNGGLIVEGSIDSGGTDYGYYQSAGTNIILKGDGSGRSGLFFESEKNGTNINDPSDYGFIQFHAYGYGNSSGEANGLYIGVANDSTDGLVLQTPYNGGAKIGYKNATSGTGLTTETIASREWVNSQNFLTTADGNNYLTGVSGSGNGTVTFTRQGLSNLTWDASHTHSQYLTGNQTITLTGDATGSGTTSIAVTVVDDSHNHNHSDGDFTVNGDLYGKSVNAQYSNLYRFGGLYFTWDSDTYGTNTNHSIRSTYGDTYGDSITLNSYGHIRMNIDSNNNGTNYFEVGGHTTGTSNTYFQISDTGTTVFPGLSLGISNTNADPGTGTYFRGNSSHFVLGLDSGNTLYLNYGNSAGNFRTYGTHYHNDNAVGTPWGSSNDGSGSGLDADTLDGIDSTSFLRSDANDTYTGTLTLGTSSEIKLPNSAADGILTSTGHRVINSQDSTLRIGDTNKHNIVRLHGQDSDNFKVYYNSTDYEIWHAGNDGSGSGLDADKTDGKHIWVGTLTQYNAITTKDANTIYFIT